MGAFKGESALPTLQVGNCCRLDFPKASAWRPQPWAVSGGPLGRDGGCRGHTGHRVQSPPGPSPSPTNAETRFPEPVPTRLGLGLRLWDCFFRLTSVCVQERIAWDGRGTIGLARPKGPPEPAQG